jgi:hypothetical protein
MATAAPKKTAAPAKSRWAQMRDQARAERAVREPYMFDGTSPPTPITAPDSVERVTAVAEFVDARGRFDFSNLRKLFAAVCGDAFDTVWDVVRDEPVEVLIPLITDINEHFNSVPSVPGDEGDDLPGGA